MMIFFKWMLNLVFYSMVMNHCDDSGKLNDCATSHVLLIY